jgi:hypothetical protein
MRCAAKRSRHRVGIRQRRVANALHDMEAAKLRGGVRVRVKVDVGT